MQITCEGRVALVTGASLGIGRAIAARLVDAGADVAMVARRPDVLEAAAAEVGRGAKGHVVAVVGDVSTLDGCAAVVAAAQERLGRVDILVNNAGSSKRGAFATLTDADWQADLDLKLFAAVRLARALLPGMVARRWGRIINVLNTAAKAPPAEGAPTAVTRAAGLALTKVLAGEGAAHNVLVNALLVGRIESDQWVRRHAAEVAMQGGTGRTLTEYYAEMSRNIPMRRVGTAEEFANMACFLASEQASYVTGTAINVDGGMCPVV